MIEMELLASFIRHHHLAEGASVAPFEVYCFGSALKTRTPRDIDILIVYDSIRVRVAAVLELRQLLAESFRRTFNVELDICLMSSVEARENSFIRDEGAVRLV